MPKSLTHSIDIKGAGTDGADWTRRQGPAQRCLPDENKALVALVCKRRNDQPPLRLGLQHAGPRFSQRSLLIHQCAGMPGCRRPASTCCGDLHWAQGVGGGARAKSRRPPPHPTPPPRPGTHHCVLPPVHKHAPVNLVAGKYRACSSRGAKATESAVSTNPRVQASARAGAQAAARLRRPRTAC